MNALLNGIFGSGARLEKRFLCIVWRYRPDSLLVSCLCMIDTKAFVVLFFYKFKPLDEAICLFFLIRSIETLTQIHIDFRDEDFS